MKHQYGRAKLNLRGGHRTAMVRNQAMILIEHGKVTSTKANVKEVQRFTERLVTIAREGNNFNARRRVNSLLPYKDSVVEKLFKDVAPKYATRPGGYTRVISLGKRASDTAEIALLTWVE
jgi:large subunit ribosomal protein L17